MTPPRSRTRHMPSGDPRRLPQVAKPLRQGRTWHAAVRAEVAHIPKGDEPADGQSELRMVFAIQRQHDLASDPRTPLGLSLERALSSVRARRPGTLLRYDAPFFGTVNP